MVLPCLHKLNWSGHFDVSRRVLESSLNRTITGERIILGAAEDGETKARRDSHRERTCKSKCPSVAALKFHHDPGESRHACAASQWLSLISIERELVEHPPAPPGPVRLSQDECSLVALVLRRKAHFPNKVTLIRSMVLPAYCGWQAFAFPARSLGREQ